MTPEIIAQMPLKSFFKRYSGRSDRADDRGVKCSVSVVGGTGWLIIG